MTPIHLQNALHLPKKYTHLLLDMVGVIYNGKTLFPSAQDTIEALQAQNRTLVFLTNNPRPSSFIQEKIVAMGMPDTVPIFSSGDATRAYIAAHHPHQKIYHLGQRKNNELFYDQPSLLTDTLEDADLVVLSAFTESDEDTGPLLQHLNEIAQSSLPVLCANPDITAPWGDTVRKTAGFYGAYLAEKGKAVTYLGKPNTLLYDMLFQKFDMPHTLKENTLMVGDTLETDILGANTFGIDSLLVLSGNTGEDIKRVGQSPQVFLEGRSRSLTPTYYCEAL